MFFLNSMTLFRKKAYEKCMVSNFFLDLTYLSCMGEFCLGVFWRTKNADWETLPLCKQNTNLTKVFVILTQFIKSNSINQLLAEFCNGSVTKKNILKIFIEIHIWGFAANCKYIWKSALHLCDWFLLQLKCKEGRFLFKKKWNFVIKPYWRSNLSQIFVPLYEQNS